MNVHLSDIAKKVGVSKMTVSRALRDDPAVSPANRKRILAAAKELDYTPNPKLAQLMSEMAQSRTHISALGELAYITTEDTEFGWKEYYHQLSSYEGAKAEAKTYGYTLLPVWALSRRFTRGRLTEFLWSRGVDGLIVQPLGRGMIGRSLDIDWSRFCSVQIGATLSAPKLNLVRHNHYDGMTQTLLAMEQLGYARIGLCFSSDSDIRSYHRWAAAYLYWRTIRGFTDRTLPSFHYAAGQVDPRVLKTWIRQHRITGIVGMGLELVNTCRKIGLKVPDDIGISVLDRPGEESKVAGIDQRAAQIGRMAVDLLIMAVRKGVKGVPEHPLQTIVEGKWVPGDTVRLLKPAAQIKSPQEMTDIQSSF
jgi:LacI family transcriptional regulator